MNVMTNLTTIDLLIFISYFLILIFIGFWSGRKKKKDATDFFLAQGKLSWYVIGFAMIAAGISSEQFLGTVGFAFSHGISVANWEWLNGPSLLVLIFIFIPFYLRKRVVTMPQFLEMRYDNRTRVLFAAITILTYVFINLAGVIYSGGFALNVIFGINLYTAIWSMTLLAGAFAIWGGMATVAWTNVFQSVLLLGGGLLVFVLGLIEIPGGVGAIVGTGDRSHLILPADDPHIPWTALIVLAFSTNIWYYCTNQTINQATLGAKNEWHAKIGIIFAGLLWITIAFADVFPGLIAYVLDPGIVPDSAYPFVVDRLVPAGLKGIVFAGLCGAIVSTIEALINAASTIFTIDLYPRFRREEPTQKELIRVGRITGGIILVTGAVWAPTVLKFGHIFSYFQECWAFIAVPVVVVFLAGVLWKKTTSRAAFWTLCLSFPMLILPYLLRIFHVEMNVFNVAGLVLIGTVIFIVILTFSGTRSGPVHGNFTWSINMSRIPMDSGMTGYPWYRGIVFWSLVMMAAYAFFYAIFW
jgi:SSS family solute:Na+ symporter